MGICLSASKTEEGGGGASGVIERAPLKKQEEKVQSEDEWMPMDGWLRGADQLGYVDDSMVCD